MQLEKIRGKNPTTHKLSEEVLNATCREVTPQPASQLSVCKEREEDGVLPRWELVASIRKAPGGGGGGVQGEAYCW